LARAQALEPDGVVVVLAGPTIRPEIGTGIYGYEGTANVGASCSGLKAYPTHHALLFWDTELAAVLGALAYEHPYHGLAGGRADGEGELGLLLGEPRPLRPWISASASVDTSALWQLGQPLNGGANNNNWGDLAGPLFDGTIRLGGGAAWVRPALVAVLEAQLLGEGQSAQSAAPSRGFFGGALRFRADLADPALIALAEVTYAVRPTQRDASLGTTQSTNHWTLGLFVQKAVSERLFLGLGFRWQREQTSLSYSQGLPYTSNGPLDSRFWVLGGYTL
jgi:hypothetical protein